MSSEFIRQYPDSMISYCDTFEGSVDILESRDRYGFLTTTDACCGLGKYGGLFICVLPQMACSDASSHVWWDEFHPTDAVNRILDRHCSYLLNFCVFIFDKVLLRVGQ